MANLNSTIINGKLSVSDSVSVGGVQVSSQNIKIRGTTTANPTQGQGAPGIEFTNEDDTQNVTLAFDDYDSYKSPAGLTLSGNQGNEYLIAPRFIKTGASANDILLGDGSTLSVDDCGGKVDTLNYTRDGQHWNQIAAVTIGSDDLNQSEWLRKAYVCSAYGEGYSALRVYLGTFEIYAYKGGTNIQAGVRWIRIGAGNPDNIRYKREGNKFFVYYYHDLFDDVISFVREFQAHMSLSLGPDTALPSGCQKAEWLNLTQGGLTLTNKIVGTEAQFQLVSTNHEASINYHNTSGTTWIVGTGCGGPTYAHHFSFWDGAMVAASLAPGGVWTVSNSVQTNKLNDINGNNYLLSDQNVCEIGRSAIYLHLYSSRVPHWFKNGEDKGALALQRADDVFYEAI